MIGQDTMSLNRSGHAHTTIQTVENGLQTDICCADRPKLCVSKKYATEDIKSACAMVSSACGVSNENARKCVSSKMP